MVRGCFPAVVLSARGEVGIVRIGDRPTDLLKEFRLLRTFALVALGAYLFGNLMQRLYVSCYAPRDGLSGSYRVSACYSLFARANPAAVLLLYLLFWSQKKTRGSCV